MLKVLVACEESQRVCTAFRERGFNAYSADIQKPSGGHPEWHILGDVLKVINPCYHGYTNKYNIIFHTMDGTMHTIDKWDLIIAHPPCTYLTLAGNRWFNIAKYGEKAKQRYNNRENAIKFFMNFVNAKCEHIAIENPIGVINTVYKKPDQIIQPYEYGHPYRKSTCLWLKNLPLLQSTKIVDFECIHSKGKSGGYSGNSWVVRDENGKILPYNDARVAKARSKTFEGIARAMAHQWGDYLLGKTDRQLSLFEEDTDAETNR